MYDLVCDIINYWVLSCVEIVYNYDMTVIEMLEIEKIEIKQFLQKFWFTDDFGVESAAC